MYSFFSRSKQNPNRQTYQEGNYNVVKTHSHLGGDRYQTVTQRYNRSNELHDTLTVRGEKDNMYGDFRGNQDLDMDYTNPRTEKSNMKVRLNKQGFIEHYKSDGTVDYRYNQGTQDSDLRRHPFDNPDSYEKNRKNYKMNETMSIFGPRIAQDEQYGEDEEYEEDNRTKKKRVLKELKEYHDPRSLHPLLPDGSAEHENKPTPFQLQYNEDEDESVEQKRQREIDEKALLKAEQNQRQRSKYQSKLADREETPGETEIRNYKDSEGKTIHETRTRYDDGKKRYFFQRKPLKITREYEDKNGDLVRETELPDKNFKRTERFNGFGSKNKKGGRSGAQKSITDEYMKDGYKHEDTYGIPDEDGKSTTTFRRYDQYNKLHDEMELQGKRGYGEYGAAIRSGQLHTGNTSITYTNYSDPTKNYAGDVELDSGGDVKSPDGRIKMRRFDPQSKVLRTHAINAKNSALTQGTSSTSSPVDPFDPSSDNPFASSSDSPLDDPSPDSPLDDPSSGALKLPSDTSSEDVKNEIDDAMKLEKDI